MVLACESLLTARAILETTADAVDRVVLSGEKEKTRMSHVIRMQLIRSTGRGVSTRCHTRYEVLPRNLDRTPMRH